MWRTSPATQRSAADPNVTRHGRVINTFWRRHVSLQASDGASRALFLNLRDGSTINCGTVGGDGVKASIANPFFTMAAGVQPTLIEQLLVGPANADGFGNRFSFSLDFPPKLERKFGERQTARLNLLLKHKLLGLEGRAQWLIVHPTSTYLTCPPPLRRSDNGNKAPTGVRAKRGSQAHACSNPAPQNAG